MPTWSECARFFAIQAGLKIAVLTQNHNGVAVLSQLHFPLGDSVCRQSPRVVASAWRRHAGVQDRAKVERVTGALQPRTFRAPREFLDIIKELKSLRSSLPFAAGLTQQMRPRGAGESKPRPIVVRRRSAESVVYRTVYRDVALGPFCDIIDAKCDIVGPFPAFLLPIRWRSPPAPTPSPTSTSDLEWSGLCISVAELLNNFCNF